MFDRRAFVRWLVTWPIVGRWFVSGPQMVSGDMSDVVTVTMSLEEYTFAPRDDDDVEAV